MIGSDLRREGEEKLATLRQEAQLRHELPRGVWRLYAAQLLRRLAARLESPSPRAQPHAS
jgi:hypothetical protein